MLARSFSGGSQKGRSLPKLLLRLAVTMVLLTVVYGKADRIALLKTFESLSFGVVASLLLLYTAGQILSALRWRTFLRQGGIERSFDEIVRAYFFGMLINIFGIGTVGGDVARSIALRPLRGERTAAFASVVADRLFGLLTLLLIGGVFLLFVQPSVLGWTAGPLSLALVLGFALLWVLGPLALIRLCPPSHGLGEIAARIRQVFPTDRASLVRVTVISLIFHSLQIYMHVLLARVLGAPLSAIFLFATVPLINTAASLPLSIQGVGIRESLYVLFFTPEGVAHEVCLAFGAIWILTVTLVSTVGGLLFPPVGASPADEEEIDRGDQQRAHG